MNTVTASAGAQSVPIGRNKMLVATTIGNALEFFDFTVYSFVAIIIGKLYFPTMSPYGQLLLSVATFGVGFVMRPLGGVLIGAYADRRGRKAAMTLTIYLMALGCAMIAFAPTYAQIGVAAPLIILTARLIQGFSAGGEVAASTTLLIEYATPKNRGYFGSWQFASQGLGIMLGAVLVGLLSYNLAPAAMESWGWRIPFMVGMLIAPVGLYIRSQLHETHEAPTNSKAGRSSIGIVLTTYGKDTLLGTLMIIGGTVCAYIITFYMPTYAIRELGLPMPLALMSAILSGFLMFVVSPFVGRWADSKGRKPLILYSRIAFVILVYPGFLWLTAEPSSERLLLIVGVLSILTSIQAAPAITMIPEMFPKEVRVTGMSVVYSVGVALFGGFAQFFATWLIQLTGSKLAPAWYLIVLVSLSTVALFWIKDKTGRAIDGEKP